MKTIEEIGKVIDEEIKTYIDMLVWNNKKCNATDRICALNKLKERFGLNPIDLKWIYLHICY